MGRRSKPGEVSLASLLPGVGGDMPRCKECGRRRPWGKLATRYKIKKHGEIWRFWYCDFCGAKIRKDNVTDLELAYEIEKKEQDASRKRQLRRAAATRKGSGAS